MIVLTVHEPPEPPADRLEHAAELTFVRDGFSWVAAILGPIWMLSARLWLATLGYVAVMLVLAGLFAIGGWDARWLGLLVAAAHVWIGFESSSLQRWTLDRRGWKLLSAVAGRDVEECERRFFDGWLPPPRVSREEEVMAMIRAARREEQVARDVQTAPAGIGARLKRMLWRRADA